MEGFRIDPKTFLGLAMPNQYSLTVRRKIAIKMVLGSRHTVVCRAAQENGAFANGVSILTGTTKSQFSRICSLSKWH